MSHGRSSGGQASEGEGWAALALAPVRPCSSRLAPRTMSKGSNKFVFPTLTFHCAAIAVGQSRLPCRTSTAAGSSPYRFDRPAVFALAIFRFFISGEQPLPDTWYPSGRRLARPGPRLRRSGRVSGVAGLDGKATSASRATLQTICLTGVAPGRPGVSSGAACELRRARDSPDMLKRRDGSVTGTRETGRACSEALLGCRRELLTLYGGGPANRSCDAQTDRRLTGHAFFPPLQTRRTGTTAEHSSTTDDGSTRRTRAGSRRGACCTRTRRRRSPSASTGAMSSSSVTRPFASCFVRTDTSEDTEVQANERMVLDAAVKHVDKTIDTHGEKHSDRTFTLNRMQFSFYWDPFLNGTRMSEFLDGSLARTVGGGVPTMAVEIGRASCRERVS